jgi:hypothetical protein
MSAVDDALFAPIYRTWKEQCEAIVRYILSRKHEPQGNPRLIRPIGALYLYEFCRLFHEDSHRFFRVVYYRANFYVPPRRATFEFDGRLQFDRYENWGCPHIPVYRDGSIRDLNLVPNLYTDNYVFMDPDHADEYYNFTEGDFHARGKRP